MSSRGLTSVCRMLGSRHQDMRHNRWEVTYTCGKEWSVGDLLPT
jgi:hypothetical protein